MTEFNTQLADQINAAVAKALGGLASQPRKRRTKAKGKGRAKSTPEEKAARMAANDAECIKVFTAAGFKDVKPRVNVLTYGKVKPDGTVTGWLGQGRRVKKGEKHLPVGPFRLFHIDQTEKIEAEKAAA